MWIVRHECDQGRGIDFPMPTQAVSSEEFIRPPQTAGQEKWPKGDYFSFDVQTHFTNNFPLPMRTGWVRSEG